MKEKQLIKYHLSKAMLNWVLLAALLFLGSSLLQGCSTPEGGSSLPWSQPEPWEQQPQMGVPF